MRRITGFMFIFFLLCISSSGIDNLNNKIDGLQPGDTLDLPSGELFLTSNIVISVKGTSDKWIVIRGNKNHGTILNGFGYIFDQEQNRSVSAAFTGIIRFKDAQFIKLENIVVKDSRNVGILVGDKRSPSKNIVIDNCKSINSYGSGISVWYADSVTIRNSEITGANDQEMRTEGHPLRREAPHEALTLAGATNFDVYNNHVHHCQKEGIDCKEVSSYGEIHHNYIHDMPRQGLYVDSWFGTLRNVKVYENIVHKCEWGCVVSAEGKDSYLENVEIYNNLLFDNTGSGFYFGCWGHQELRNNIFIYNNTIINNGSKDHWAGATGGVDIRSENLRNVFIFNNIIANNKNFEIAIFEADNINSVLKTKNIRIENNVLKDELNDFEEEVAPYGKSDAYQGKNTVYAKPVFKGKIPDSPDMIKGFNPIKIDGKGFDYAGARLKYIPDPVKL